MYKELSYEDKSVIKEALHVVRQNYKEPQHTIGSALLCGSGKIYRAINVDSTGPRLCAEQIALGSALSFGERIFKKIVAINKEGTLIPPCGSCRQLLFNYAPDINVILMYNDLEVLKNLQELLPQPYEGQK